MMNSNRIENYHIDLDPKVLNDKNGFYNHHFTPQIKNLREFENK